MFIYDLKNTKDKHLSVCVTADSRCAISCTKLMRRNLQILYCNPFTDRTALCGCNQLCPYTQSSLLFRITSLSYHIFLGKSTPHPSSAIFTIICTAFSIEETGMYSYGPWKLCPPANKLGQGKPI